MMNVSEMSEAATVKRLFDIRITLSNCSSPEPSIRMMVEHYYKSHNMDKWKALADITLGYIANSSYNTRIMQNEPHPDA